MSDLINPHDRFFKDLLSRPEAAVDFLTNYLPPEIAALLDLSAPELVKDSFVDEELRQHFSDLLYRVNLKRGGDALIYILFEHKSGPDEWIALQLLRNEIRALEAARRNGMEERLLIFPLVFYQERGDWNVARQFSALFTGDNRDDLNMLLQAQGKSAVDYWLTILRYFWALKFPNTIAEFDKEVSAVFPEFAEKNK